MTAGTIFDRTRTPLTVWFAACWLFALGKDGISALSLQRTLEIGSYQTAWMLLHRLRFGLVRPGRQRLQGRVEADESYFGGEEAGLKGGRARGKKVLVGIAVEVHEPKGFGRCRMAVLQDASRSSLHPFVLDHIEPGSTVLTDAWMSYRGLEKLAMATSGVASVPLLRPVTILARSCLVCIGSQHWPNGGCSAPTREQWTPSTSRATSTSSCSASTVATPPGAAWSSTGS